MTKLLEFYNKILPLGGLHADTSGHVKALFDSTLVPFLCGGKQMMLPTPEVLRLQNKDDLVIFHPLSEHIALGESEVMQRYRGIINQLLNFRICLMLELLTRLAASPAEHKNMPFEPDHLAIMELFKDADAKTHQAFLELAKLFKRNEVEKSFVHIYIKKGAHIGGRDYRRGAVVSFPFYEELVKDDTTVWGVKLRKKDHAMFKALMENLFPNLAEKGSYSRGGTSELAPTLSALLRAMGPLVGSINGYIETFEGILDELRPLKYEVAWFEESNNLDAFSNEVWMIPPQVGNEGTLAPRASAPVPSMTITGQPLPPPGAPVGLGHLPYGAQPAAAPVVRSPDGTLSMSDLYRQNPAVAAAAAASYTSGSAQRPMSGADALRAQGPSWGSPFGGIRSANI